MAPSQRNPSEETKKPTKIKAVKPHLENQCSRRRRSLFLNRKSTLKKKTWELATLCGVTACMVYLGPDGECDTWPENQREVENVLMKYKAYKEKGKGKSKTEKKLEKEESKIMHGNSEKVVKLVDESSSKEWLMEFGNFLDSKMKALDEKVLFLRTREKGKAKVQVPSGEISHNTPHNPNLNANDESGFANSDISPWENLNAGMGFGIFNDNLMDGSFTNLLMGDDGNNFVLDDGFPLWLELGNKDFGVIGNFDSMGQNIVDGSISDAMFPPAMGPWHALSNSSQSQ